MSDCTRIYNYVTSESLIVKSEMKSEKSDNSDNLSLLSLKNDEDYALYDRCYILHDPFTENWSSARPIKMENTDDPILENIESLDKFSDNSIKSENNLNDLSLENLKIPVTILDGNKPFSSDIFGNNDSTRSNSNDKLEIIDLNEEIFEKELISFDNLELSIRENSNGKVDKLIFKKSKNSEKTVMKFAKYLKSIPDSSSNSFSNSNSSCKSKRKTEKQVFVLKRHSKIVENHSNIDYNHMKLKDLINMEPLFPAPKSRANYKSLKDCIKLKSKSQKFHQRNHKSDRKITNEFRIDHNGQIVLNEIDDDDDNSAVPVISDMEEIVINSADIKSTSCSFKARKLSGKRWNSEEKENFYKALMITGTDFTRMASIFPKRSRADLKKKFKVEEKLNPKLIEKILRNPVICNPSLLKLDSHLVSKKQRKPGYNKKSI